MKFSTGGFGYRVRKPSGVQVAKIDPLAPAVMAKRIDAAIEHGNFYGVEAQEVRADLIKLRDQLVAAAGG